MVVALGPGKFYGSSLPRPRIYTDVKFNDDRVDPPVSVLDPLISWAHEAHWSMGGLSFKRLRLQGRIEGSIKKLRAEREKFLKKRKHSETTDRQIGKSSAKDSESNKSSSPSPPPAPIAVKRRRFMALLDEEDDNEGKEMMKSGDNGGGLGVRVVKRRLTRKLGDDFDRVAMESGIGEKRGSPVKGSSGWSEVVGSRTRGRRSEEGGGSEVVKVVEKLNELKSNGKKLKGNVKGKGSSEKGGTRTSPRLARRGSR
ncbi:unnamed protein product [Ilex paraguariensis]|uniref:Uncharacterized protein n=1 Tax=Ilex paraguariensis TaxID=185542 RepID=A0ABC8SRV1_9AQUA